MCILLSFLEVNMLVAQFLFRAKFSPRQLHPPYPPCTTLNSLESWSWGVVLGRSPFVKFLSNFATLIVEEIIVDFFFAQKNAPNISWSDRHENGWGGCVDVDVVVIEVHWRFNLRKPIVWQNAIALQMILLKSSQILKGIVRVIRKVPSKKSDTTVGLRLLWIKILSRTH